MKDFLKKKHHVIPLLFAALLVSSLSYATPHGPDRAHEETLAGPENGAAELHRSVNSENPTPDARQAALQQEEMLLRAEAQGFTDQGALSAIHLREQKLQREIRELR